MKEYIMQIDQVLYNEETSEWCAEPKVAGELIRCKDCAYKNKYKFPPKYDEKYYCEKHEKVVDEACFCSWAERK